MANISQITQELTQFGPAPDSLDPATFNQRADATVAHLHTHVDEQNTVTKQTNKVTREINERATDIDGKYDEIVEKYVDFIPKYNEVVTKHGQIVTMHKEVEADAVYVGARKGEIDAIKTHVDQTKTQIDIDLATAKSYINDGNGGVIDDTKNSDVSTWSSNELQRRLDLKADEATAYKDWSYKTISNTYAAQDNDALFVEATAPFEITLPVKGKVRIIDKAGNFATHNIKLIAGSDKFVLNKDFQRVELFFFNGKWQVVGGYLLVERSGYLVNKISKNKKDMFGTKAVDKYFVKDNFIIAYPGTSNLAGNSLPAAFDLDTMTDVTPALPSVPSNTSLFCSESDGELMLVGWNEGTKKAYLFKFNRGLKNWQQLSSTSLQSLLDSFGNVNYIMTIYTGEKNKNTYVRAGNASGEKLFKITTTGVATDCGNITNGITCYIYDDICFGIHSNSGVFYIVDCKNLRNAPLPISQINNLTVENVSFKIDFKAGKFFIRQNQNRSPNKIIEWEFGGIPQVVTKTPSTLPEDKHIYHDTLRFTKQNAIVNGKATDGKPFIYDAYENNRLVRKRESGISTQLTRNTPHYIKSNKEYFISVEQQQAYEIIFTPTTFQEEI